MNPHRSPLERMLDLTVYAPLGAALALRDHLPSLAGEGRRRLASQTRLARMVGEMAVNEGRRQVASVIDRRAEGRRGAGPAPTSDGERPAGADPARVKAAASSSSASSSSAPSGSAPSGSAPSGSAPSGSAPSGPRASDSGLAIPGYDTLSASQVVQRLEGLGPAELAAVRAHEEAGRNRKTVLLRITQLGA